MAVFVVSCMRKGETVEEMTVSTDQLGLKDTDVMILPVCPVAGTTSLLISFISLSTPMISLIVTIPEAYGKVEG